MDWYEGRTLGRYAAKTTLQAARADMPPLFYYDASGVTQIAGKAAFANDWAVASAAGSRELARQESDYALAYATCVWAFRGINIRAQRVASLLYRWGRVVDKATGKAVDNHPLQAALDLVYRTYRQDLFEEWQISKCLYGEAYIEKVNAEVAGIRLHLPLTFRLLNALGVEPRIQRGAIVGYDYQDDAGSVAFTPEQIAFDKAYNPLDDNRGLSLLAAALDAVNVDRQLLILTRANLRNNMRPGIIFTPRNGAITPTDEGQIKAAIEERGKGATNAGRPLFMPIPMDVTTVNPPSFEDQDTLNEQQKRRIAAAVGVPVGLIDHTDQAFQLSPEQKRALYELTLLPAAEKMARIVDVDLLPFVDNSGRYRYELASEEVLASVEDAGARISLANSKLAAGGISLNEYRQEVNMPPLERGDLFYLPAGSLQVPVDQIGTLQAKPSYMPFSNPQVTIQQAAQLAEGAGIDVPPTPPPQTNPEGEAPVSLVEGALAAPSAVPATNSVTPVPTVGKSLCVMLGVANQPDLIALQGRVKQLYSDVPVNWNSPEDFHITLLYAPAVTDEQMTAVRAALETLEVPDIELGVGSLKTFDNLGEYALHFRVRRNTDLLELQETLYDMALDNGIAVSAYSNPAQYIPHITVGYAKSKPRAVTFQSKITVQPDTLLVTYGDENAYIVRRSLSVPVVSKTAQTDADSELKTWQKFALKHGAVKAQRFETYAVDALTAAYLRLALDDVETPTDADSIRAVFTDALTLVKVYADTRAAFRDEIVTYIRQGQQQETDRRAFAAKMRAALRRFGLLAFRDGFNDGGADPESYSPEELAAFRDWQARQSGYVSKFGAELFKDGITDLEVSTRADMWANKSLGEIYHEGLALAAPKKPYRWQRNPRKDSCTDCISLDGQVRTMKEWKDSIMPQSDKLECKGFDCGCKLVAA